MILYKASFLRVLFLCHNFELSDYIIKKNIMKIAYFGRLSYFCFVNEDKKMMRCECEMRIK